MGDPHRRILRATVLDVVHREHGLSVESRVLAARGAKFAKHQRPRIDDGRVTTRRTSLEKRETTPRLNERIRADEEESAAGLIERVVQILRGQKTRLHCCSRSITAGLQTDHGYRDTGCENDPDGEGPGETSVGHTLAVGSPRHQQSDQGCTQLLGHALPPLPTPVTAALYRRSLLSNSSPNRHVAWRLRLQRPFQPVTCRSSGDIDRQRANPAQVEVVGEDRPRILRDPIWLREDLRMNWVDVVLLVLLAIAGIHGLRLGAAIQVLSFGGFWVGLFIGALTVPSLVGLVHTTASKSIIAAVVIFGMAGILGGVGRFLGVHSNVALRRVHLGPVDSAAGAVVAMFATLVAAWLVAGILTNSRFTSLNSAVANSHILRATDELLPAPPTIFSKVESFLESKGFPVVFAGLPPQAAPPVTPPSDSAISRRWLPTPRRRSRSKGRDAG